MAGQGAEVTGGEVMFHIEAKIKSADFHVPAIGANGKNVEAKLDFDPARPEATQLRIQVNFFGADSGNELRDNKMLDTVEAYITPYAIFQTKEVTVVEDQVVGAVRNLSLQVSGDFEVKGQPVAMKTVVKVRIEGDRATAKAKFDTSLKAHRIKAPNLVGIKVGDVVPVTVDLSFKLDGPGLPPAQPKAGDSTETETREDAP
jgi:hypothetical protein